MPRDVQKGGTPGERLTLDGAVGAFTHGAAEVVGETELGAIEAGMKADLTLWQDDRGAPGRMVPVATVVAGEVVWTAASPVAF